MKHFIVNVQLISSDLPARSKCNQIVNHNGYFACSRCLMKGTRCPPPCGRHTLYQWSDFIRSAPLRRTQEHINQYVEEIDRSNKSSFGVIGVSPLSALLSIPKQSTFDYFHLVLEVHLR